MFETIKKFNYGNTDFSLLCNLAPGNLERAANAINKGYVNSSSSTEQNMDNIGELVYLCSSMANGNDKGWPVNAKDNMRLRRATEKSSGNNSQAVDLLQSRDFQTWMQTSSGLPRNENAEIFKNLKNDLFGPTAINNLKEEYQDNYFFYK